ncbi:MAG: tol-pal system protein YbgF [Candidatus Aminicenantes bacterium]|nr:MAG: tol-pal system protein YbgF [Candidatus Aminicenantes bacterium]
MIYRLFLRVLLSLLIPLMLFGAQKERKAYELIYQDVQILKQQVLELDDKIGLYQDELQTIKQQIVELMELVRALQSQQVSMQEDQKKIPSQYQILLEKLDAMSVQLTRFSVDLMEIKNASLPLLQQAEKAEGSGETQGEEIQPPVTDETGEELQEGEGEEEPKSPLPPNMSPQEIYNMAYADYLKGNFALAIDGFKIYLDNFAQSPFADNALYWIGECYFSQKEYEEAISRYNELILNYPLGDKVPAAYLHKGISLMELDRNEEALSVFKLMVSKYPLEEETKIAQEKIKELMSKNERYQ